MILKILLQCPFQLRRLCQQVCETFKHEPWCSIALTLQSSMERKSQKKNGPPF